MTPETIKKITDELSESETLSYWEEHFVAHIAALAIENIPISIARTDKLYEIYKLDLVRV